MYKINGVFDYGNGHELTNPTWEIVSQNDKPKDKVVHIEVNLYVVGTNFKYSKSYEMSYVDTWEDTTTLAYILSIPDFQNSISI